jgi:hypothetical protein
MELVQLNDLMAASYIGPPPPPGWKPTHVTTYGENANGEFCAYTTNLATNETETVVLSPIKWTPDMLDLWRSVPEKLNT